MSENLCPGDGCTCYGNTELHELPEPRGYITPDDIAKDAGFMRDETEDR